MFGLVTNFNFATAFSEIQSKMTMLLPNAVKCFKIILRLVSALSIEAMEPATEEEILHLHLWEAEEREADRRQLSNYHCPCKIAEVEEIVVY